MAHVEILRGISGSGKSTYARTQTDAIIVSRDRAPRAYGDDPECKLLPVVVNTCSPCIRG